MAAWAQAGTQAAAIAADFISKQQEMAQRGRAIDEASRNQGIQNFMQQLAMDRQYKLSTAGSKDAYGNQMVYNPTTNQWVSMLSPEGQALLNRSDAVQRNQDVRNLTQGEAERDQAFSRRQQEGATASPLLTQMRYGYGAPTREGTEGTERVSAATSATQPGEDAKAGFTMAALRSGSGGVPLESTLAGIDRSQTGSLREAMAKNYRPLSDEALTGWNSSKFNLYSPLAARASNVGDIPFTPSSIPGTMDNALVNRSVRAPSTAVPYGVAGGGNAASKMLIDAIGANKGMDWGKQVGALGNTIAGLFEKKKPVPYEGVPWNEDSRNPSAYNNWEF